MHTNIHSSTIFNNQDMETTRVHQPMIGLRRYDVCVDHGLLFSYRKEESIAIFSNADGPTEYYA